MEGEALWEEDGLAEGSLDGDTVDDTAADSVPPCVKVESKDALVAGEADGGIAVSDEATLTTGKVLEDDDGQRLEDGE